VGSGTPEKDVVPGIIRVALLVVTELRRLALGLR
jgi:hypothetical protein